MKDEQKPPDADGSRVDRGVHPWGWHAGDGMPAYPADLVERWTGHDRDRMRHAVYAEADTLALADAVMTLNNALRDAERERDVIVPVGLGAWLPIETAPKDSKARLVWVPENKCMFCVSWTAGNSGPGEDGDQAGWVIFGGGYRTYLRDGRPTHWMPLPAPPQSA